MDTMEVILISAAITVLGVRLYQKFIRKNQEKPGNMTSSGSSFPSLHQDDDYEPYRK